MADPADVTQAGDGYGGADGFQGGDDGVNLDLIDDSKVPPLEQQGGTQGGKADAQEFFIEGEGGARIPVKVNGGKIELPAGYSQGSQRGYVSQSELQSILETQRNRILQDIQGGGDGRERPEQGAGADDDKNPYDFETELDKWIQHEFSSRDKRHQSELAQVREQYESMSLEGRRQQIHTTYRNEFEEASAKIGIPKPTSMQEKSLLDEMLVTVGKDDRHRYNGGNMSTEQILGEKWRLYQAVIDQRIAREVEGFRKSGSAVRPMPHNAGAAGAAPGASGRPQGFDKRLLDYDPKVAIKRMLEQKRG